MIIGCPVFLKGNRLLLFLSHLFFFFSCVCSSTVLNSSFQNSTNYLEINPLCIKLICYFHGYISMYYILPIFYPKLAFQSHPPVTEGKADFQQKMTHKLNGVMTQNNTKCKVLKFILEAEKCKRSGEYKIGCSYRL